MTNRQTITETTQMTVLSCAGCSMKFAMTTDFETRRLNDHRRFYCPAGCTNYYDGETEADKLRREVQNLRQQQARLEDETREALRKADAELKARKRIEKRVHAGVCPDCNRTFANMARHMATKHKTHCDAPTLKVVK